MAKVIGPLHSTEARGRIDSLVYGTWRGIRFVRTYIEPVFGSPDPRIAQKALVAAANASWKLLSAAQQASWHHYAQEHPRIDWSGVPIRISGYNAYISCHTICSRAGGSPLSVAPTTALPYALSTLTLAQVGNTIVVTWTYPTQPTGHTYKVHILRSGPWSLGKQPDRHWCTIKAIEGIATSPWSDTITISGRYGYWARVVDVTTGELSTEIRAQIDFVLITTGTVIGHLQESGSHAPIPNINVTCGGKNANSNALGNFTILLVPAGAQIVTPNPAAWSWTPTHKHITVVATETYDSGTFEGGPM